jgi:very-short-patch-repair endonuclease
MLSKNGIYMINSLLNKLESARKELLDLGMRNSLLNYKIPQARGLHIVQEKSSSIYHLLVRQSKPMSFLGRPGKDDEPDFDDLPELSEEELLDAYNDTRLQTNETEKKLQTKILNTYYFARTSIEEQGVNILYLSLGMLKWFEEGNKDNVRRAPLILVPVSLERSSANERFRVRYSGNDIGGNLSLQAKFLADFNITIPDLPEIDELDIDTYFDKVSEKIAHVPAWSVEKDDIELGFFSFGKFMIYNDLDSSKWPDSKKPYDNATLKALFETGFRDTPPTSTEEHNLDTETNAESLLSVVDADSSQVLAMLAVQEGKNMVIQGPPGTGKSQTITNIIANAVGQGKKVLFVAEKMAALEVVKRRLDKVGLGEACLELHSHKANKKELHEELKRILDLGKPMLMHLEREVALLKEHKEELNAYCDAINSIVLESGLSTQQVLGHLLRINEESEGFNLPKLKVDYIQNWSQEKMVRAEAMCDRVQARLSDIGIPTKLLFWGSELKMLLPNDEEELRDTLTKAYENLLELNSETVKLVAEFGLQLPGNLQSVDMLRYFADVALESPNLNELAIDDFGWLQNRADLIELLDSGEKLSKIRADYQGIFLPEAWEQNVLEIRQDLIAHGSKWYKFVIGSYKVSNKRLASFCISGLPDSLQQKVAYIDAILEAKRLQSTIKDLEPIGLRVFGNRWLQHRSDWYALRKCADYLKTVHELVKSNEIDSCVFNFLKKDNATEIARTSSASISVKQKKYTESMQPLISMLRMGENFVFPKTELFEAQLDRLEKWNNRLAEIHQVIAWNTLEETVANENLHFLTEASLSWPEASSHLKLALQKTWYVKLLELSLSSSMALRRFERTSHEEVVEKFKKADLLKFQYNRAVVALRHWEGVPKGEAGGQVNILRAEFNKKSRHKPIRKLVQEAGLAIQAIKPVVMMSPMSIANFIPPGAIQFDLVIFDEASQVRPVEALGALLRGRQLVVVGDTKQLPPTSFFDKMPGESDDEDNVTADMQSILGMCNGQGVSERMLRWHYRSRHESLISLSNKEFYENRLVIFPSPGSKSRMGLRYHYLPDTIYEKGTTSTNPKEAEYVADAVIEHALKTPKQTLGVVAFSTKQMQAIQFALEIKRRKNPAAEAFFTSHMSEPFFVKNLENVQGDERDVIFISVGYGRVDRVSKPPQSFGPLNNEGGERRLNVLITRAKLRCEVFTNLVSEDIEDSGKKFGVKALKSFLYFAQHGKFSEAKPISFPKSTPFEDFVEAQLTKSGYTLRRHVGSEGYNIDLAVVDNENPGRYLLGIECDGETYKNAKSARDRDRLRKEVLEAMGWKMSRVWSTDWFRNPERELQRLIDIIEKAKEQVVLDDVVEEEIQKELASLIREDVSFEILQPFYQLAELPVEISSQELHLYPAGKLASWIHEVVKVESPVHFDEVARRIAEAAGVSKVGSRIRQSLENASVYAVKAGLVTTKGSFLWHPGMKTPVVRERSNIPAASKKLQLISPEEIMQAIHRVTESSLAIHPDAAVPLVAKMFGFSRVTEEMRREIVNVINLAINKGVVKKEGELIKANEN